MQGSLVYVQVVQSVPPKLILDVEVENDSPDNIVWVFAWTGQVSLEAPRVEFGSLEPKFEKERFAPLYKRRFQLYWEMPYYRLERLEEERKGGDLSLDILLNVLQASFPKSATTPTSIDLLQALRGDIIHVQSPGHEKVRIPKSEWEDKLEKLGYGKVEYLELYLPPLPIGTSVDKALSHLTKAKENFSAGEYPDVLTSCRRAIDELQKLCGSTEEERKTFITQMLQDEKKAEAYSDLLEVVQKAKNFASGGPHIYWVKVADRRDAEFVLRITWAIIAFFARNLARAKD
jgi:hypothetical protein